jgi:hypothetical protein
MELFVVKNELTLTLASDKVFTNIDDAEKLARELHERNKTLYFFVDELYLVE